MMFDNSATLRLLRRVWCAKISIHSVCYYSWLFCTIH